MAGEWYLDTAKVAAFGTVLSDADVISDSDDFKKYLNKPFQYDDAYDAWVEAGYPDTDSDNWDDFVEEISGEEEEDDGDEDSE